jgi:hypothetical protein
MGVQDPVPTPVVVKDDEYGTSGFPARSVTPAVTTMVYVVPPASGAAGRKAPEASTVPATGAPPGPWTWNVDASSVAGTTASLKMALT